MPNAREPRSRKAHQTKCLTLDLVDGLSKTPNVLASDTSNRDAAILGCVDGVLCSSVSIQKKTMWTTDLLSQLVHLFSSQASVGEHADLRGDVAPVMLASELFKVLLEKSTHGDDAVSHTLDLTEPLLVQRGIIKNLRSNAGAMNRGVGVQRTDKDLDLRVDTLLLLG